MLKLNVPEMSCSHCVATIEKAVKGVDASASVHADLASKIVEIQSAASPAGIVAALDDVGYAASPV